MTETAIGSFDTFTLHVDDIDEAIAFYRDQLDFELAQDMREEDFALFRGGGLTLGLHVPFEGEGGRKPGGATGVIFSVDDVRSTFDELESRDVRIGDEIEKTPWGALSGTILDPSGNEFLVVEWLEE